MSKVFVLDTNKQPLHPVHPGWARKLLSSGQAAVWRRYPFTIILNYPVCTQEVQPLRLKLDPGSKTTGIALVNDASGEVVFAADLSHRGQAIKAALDKRRAVRRSRRQRKTRYRAPRFDNRKKPKGDIVSLSKGRQKGEIGRKEKRKAEDEPSGKVGYNQKPVPQGVFSTHE